MFQSLRKETIRFILIVASFVVVALIVWNTYIFFRRFKEEERIRMKIWAAAQAEVLQTVDLERNIGELPLEIIRTNTSIPLIIVTADNQIESRNISGRKLKDSLYLRQKIKQFSGENSPLSITYGNTFFGTIYYGNSEVLNKLRYYPIALLLIIFLFAALLFFFYKASRISAQNRLWVGMAKETAHQIGTPLSSLLGWAEILKMKHTDPSIIAEIENDIDRLNAIADRFSKIGSTPILEKLNIVEETQKAYYYLKPRISKHISFEMNANNVTGEVMLNASLYQWTIENLVKNAIDAMKGEGMVRIDIVGGDEIVKIRVADTGKGILKRHFKRIFEPGFTTKKRGWGLGLSLVKRIVEDYHGGKIRVLSSFKDKGTVMEITLNLAN